MKAGVAAFIFPYIERGWAQSLRFGARPQRPLRMQSSASFSITHGREHGGKRYG